ncbi:MAG: ATP-binding protein [bacterium]|nr:ATP-binding protein [bacterium]
MQFLNPAIQLLNRLRYPQKFMLIALVMLFPLGILAAQSASQAAQTIDFTATERVGVVYLIPVLDLLEAIQRAAADPAAQADVETAIAAVDAVDAELGEELGVPGRWMGIRTAWYALVESLDTLSVEARAQAFLALNGEIARLITEVGNGSNLILDPDIDTYYLMDTVVTKLPITLNYLSQMQLYAALAADAPSLADLERLILITQFIETNQNTMLNGLRYAFSETPAIVSRLQPAIQEQQNVLQTFLLQLEQAEITNGRSGWSSWLRDGSYAPQVAAALAQTHQLAAQVITVLDDLLAARLNGLSGSLAIVGLMAAVAVVLAAYLFAAFYVSVKRAIHTLEQTAQRMIGGTLPGGTLPETLVLENRDELAQVATAFNDIGRELIGARDRAVQASRVKDEFVATVSHELRTPLNSIIGYTNILQLGMRGQVDAEARELLGYVGDSSVRLLSLINDVLDIAKIEAGRMELLDKPFNVRALVNTWATETAGLARGKNIHFDVRIDDALPEALYGDETRITQVAINLLSNAVKFTEKGGVELAIIAQGEHWQIDVTDTGIGIPADALDYIFDEFRQVDGSTQRAYGGTGLGLAIARKLTMMMGGRIWVRSAAGEGSTFTVTLPLRTAPAPAHSIKEQAHVSETLSA